MGSKILPAFRNRKQKNSHPTLLIQLRGPRDHFTSGLTSDRASLIRDRSGDRCTLRRDIKSWRGHEGVSTHRPLLRRNDVSRMQKVVMGANPVPNRASGSRNVR